MTQFYLNGVAKKMLTGGEKRPLTAAEQIGSGFVVSHTASHTACTSDVDMAAPDLL